VDGIVDLFCNFIGVFVWVFVLLFLHPKKADIDASCDASVDIDAIRCFGCVCFECC